MVKREPGMTENTVHNVSVIYRSRAGLRSEPHPSRIETKAVWNVGRGWPTIDSARQ
jgi:hypothetical protein